MGDEGHDNSEYNAPSSRTGTAPPPPATFAPDPEDTDAVSSDAAFRQDIRDGLSEDEANERAEQRAAEAREGGGSSGGSDDDDGELKGEALDKRAAELDIEGRSDMTADQKRKAIAKAEK